LHKNVVALHSGYALTTVFLY